MGIDRRYVRYLKLVLSGAALCLVYVAGVAAARHGADNNDPPPRFATPLGRLLPDVALHTFDGHTVSLRQRLAGRPALIYVFSAAECASCSNLPLEFKIAHNEVPTLQTILIGSGSPVESFRPLVEQMGLTQSSAVDESRSLIKALDAVHEPLVLLADSAGQILLVDSRGASAAAQYPMGHILHGLAVVLGATPAAR